MHPQPASTELPFHRPAPSSFASPARGRAAAPWSTVTATDAAAADRADVFAEITPFGNSTRYRKGQTIVCEGETAERLFRVLRGVVRAYKMLPDGRRQIVGFIFPGEVFGFSPDDAYGYSVDAVTDATLHAYGSAMLERFAHERPALAHCLREVAYRELRAAQSHIVLLGRKTAFERVVSFLLSLSHRAAGTGQDGCVLWVPMSQADIADYLGLTTETVNRIVSQLREAGLVTVPSRGVMRLESPNQLEEVASAA